MGNHTQLSHIRLEYADVYTKTNTNRGTDTEVSEANNIRKQCVVSAMQETEG